MTFSFEKIYTKIQVLSMRNDNSTSQAYRQTLLAQLVEMIRSDFSFPSQILFLKTLSELPKDFFESLASEMFELLIQEDIYSSELLLAAVENFAQSISIKELNESILPMIRDFYYLLSKVFEKIPGGQEYARKYMKKMDIPYLQ